MPNHVIFLSCLLFVLCTPQCGGRIIIPYINEEGRRVNYWRTKMVLVAESYFVFLACSQTFLNVQRLTSGQDQFRTHGNLGYPAAYGYTKFTLYFGTPVGYPNPVTFSQRDNGQCVTVLTKCKSKYPLETLYEGFWPSKFKFGNAEHDQIHCGEDYVLTFILAEANKIFSRPPWSLIRVTGLDEDPQFKPLYLKLNHDRYRYIKAKYYKFAESSFAAVDPPLPLTMDEFGIDYPADDGRPRPNTPSESVCLFEETLWYSDADENMDDDCAPGPSKKRKTRSTPVRCGWALTASPSCNQQLQECTNKIGALNSTFQQIGGRRFYLKYLQPYKINTNCLTIKNGYACLYELQRSIHALYSIL